VTIKRLQWKKIAAGVYHATSPWGLYTIDGNNYGRNRWTVTYPNSDYAMVDALAEAKLEAEQDAEERSMRQVSHAKKKIVRGRYYVVQIDDEGSRRVFEGLQTVRGAAEAVVDLIPWKIDVDDFASTWIANSPDGGERFEIGMEDP
jgi:hypothetical protein